uniref:C2H2-type domain-containing protein n=1 Tax=Equus asinus asinus TaxID=83772 RepID=A0A8C4LY78_EQUAS
VRNGTREECFDLDEVGKSCDDRNTLLEYNKINVAMTHCERHESGSNFIRNSPLIQPQRTITGQGAAQSSKCEENLSQSSTHQKTQTGDKFCVFNECTNAFYEKLDLMIHQRTHSEENFYDGTGQKSFECNECRKFFYQKAHLIQHQRICSGDKTYECEECGRSFSPNSHSVHCPGTHMGVSLCECNEYAKTFCQKSNLSEHVTVHTKEKPYDHNRCGKSYKKSAIIEHQRTHTRMKPFQSNEYGKTFSKMAHLKECQRIYTGEKPYECIECGKTFSKTSLLRPVNIINVRRPIRIQPVYVHERLHMREKTSVNILNDQPSSKIKRNLREKHKPFLQSELL